MDARLKALPDDFIKRLQLMIPPGRLKDVFRAYLTPHPLTVRINTLKTNPESVTASWTRQKISFQPSRDVPGCYYPDITERKLRDSEFYQQGAIYAQNESSQIPPLFLNLSPGLRVLDACAAPGSKTSQIAAIMNNHGTIDACEPDAIRFERLKHNLGHLGATIATAHHSSAERFSKTIVEPYDRILIDAPCSGEGTFLAQSPASFYHWSEEFVFTCAKRQKKILTAVLPHLAAGGTCVYSTCALSPEENEDVVSDILTQFPNLKTQVIRNAKNSALLNPPLASWQGKTFHSGVQNAARVLPSPSREGFFICVMKNL